MAFVADDAFGRYLNQIGMVNADQIESAQLMVGEAAQRGQAMTLADALVFNGVITATQKEAVEKKLLAHQEGGLKTLGNYKLIRKLGEGGMGAVYLAEDTTMLRKVALKVLPKRFASDPVFLQRFRREAKAAGKLNHVNIISAFTVGEELGNHFYVMEYCDGESLDRILKREQALPWKRAIGITIMVARGLQHAHEQSLIHRDIKPANIFMAKGKGGEEDVARILDLGLSKEIDSDGETSFNTQSGTTVGTPHYISPEQAKGEKNIDGRTDIYSLGATLYHLLTGQTPFDGSTSALIMMKHLTDDIPNPQDLRDDIPDGVVQVLMKMMAKAPKDRYADCANLLEDLERVAEGKMPLSKAIDAGKSSVAMRRIKDPGPGVRKNAPRRAEPDGERREMAGKRRESLTAKPARPKNNAALRIAGAVAVLLIMAFVAFAMSPKPAKPPDGSVQPPPPQPALTAMQTPPAQPTPAAQPVKAQDLRPGLAATYFDGKFLEQNKVLLRRVDPNINFAWNGGSPAPEVPVDFFSARWIGFLRAPKSGQYTFRGHRDDGIRVKIDGNLVIDAWTLNNALDQSAEVNLSAGDHPISVEFNEDQGFAYCMLYWSLKGGFADEIIPPGAFFHTVEQASGIAAPRQTPATPKGADVADSMPRQLRLDLGNGVNMDLVLVPAGEFTMGSNEDGPEETPAHKVKISRPFYIGKYEVTVAQFSRFVEMTKYETDCERKGNFGFSVKDNKFVEANGLNWKTPGFAQTPEHPVVMVSWNDAQAFTAWMSKQTSHDTNLPTEAQWEYATRGTDGGKYTWGNTWDGTKANHADITLKNSGFNMGFGGAKDTDGFAYTSPAGIYENASWCGAFDMAGNVWEWVNDKYEIDYYAKSPAVDPPGGKSDWPSLRGGSWIDAPVNLRTTIRVCRPLDTRQSNVGFRVMVPATPKRAEAAVPVSPQLRLDLGNGVNMDMVVVPAGEFIMGTNESQSREKPAHKVKLSRPFYFGKYEVTVAQFKRFVEMTKYETDCERAGTGLSIKDGKWQEVRGINWKNPGFTQTPEHPVVLVSWNDAQAFAAWMTKQTSHDASLPTEAQWEYAARGAANRTFTWGNIWDGTKTNHADISLKNTGFNMEYGGTPATDGFAFTAPVGKFENASWCGAFDMMGNVWEWSQDKFENDYYSKSPEVDPPGGQSNVFGMRGGSWLDGLDYIRTTARIGQPPDVRQTNVGFRIVVSTATKAP